MKTLEEKIARLEAKAKRKLLLEKAEMNARQAEKFRQDAMKIMPDHPKQKAAE